MLATPSQPAISLARRAPGILQSGVWVTAYVLGGFSIEGLSADRQAVVWACAMIASFVGWGTAVTYLIDRQSAVDWGLRAAWGMAAFLAVGGLLVALGIANGPVLRLGVGVGIGILSAHAIRRTHTYKLGFEPLRWSIVGLVGVLALVTCVGAMTDRSPWWGYDDTPAYLVFPKQLEQSGGMLQPFSFRRMSSFGGQSLFQAILFVGAPAEQAHLFDRGLCTIVVLAMILGAPAGKCAPPFVLRVLPALLVLFLPNYRSNIAAALSGTLIFFAIFRTLELPRRSGRDERAYAVLLGLLAAAAWALQPVFALPAIAAVVLHHALERRRIPRDVLRLSAIAFAGATALAVLPWSFALLRSNGTPLFPPFDGNYQPESGFATLTLGYQRARVIWTEFRLWEPVATLPLVAVCAVLGTRADTSAYRASCLALVLGVGLALLAAPLGEHKDLVRFTYPLEVAFVLVVAMRSLSAFAFPPEPEAMAAGFLALAACAGQLYWKYDDLQTSLDGMLEQALNVLTNRALLPGAGRPPMFRLDDREVLETPMLSLHADQTYAELQRAAPAGAPILAMVEEPYLFDFRRNRIDVLDLPGIVGPAGGIPHFHGADAVQTYFRSLGYRYLALTDTSAAMTLYSLRSWESRAVAQDDFPQTRIASSVLDLFANLERIARSHPHLFETGGLTMIDLGESP